MPAVHTDAHSDALEEAGARPGEGFSAWLLPGFAPQE